MLQINNYSKSYVKEKYAVKDLNLEVNAGEIFAFIGHNGAGKTTTIKSIVGILDFNSGEIILNGINIKEDPVSFKREVAYVPDTPSLYENLTGIQYLNFISNIYNLDIDKRYESIDFYANKFDMEDKLNDQINSYSHGMRQKLLLIGAFIRKPKLLILDEPFVGLDPKATFEMKELMTSMAKEGTIIFFSTHILEVAEKFCDTVGIIKDGKLLKHGTMNEIKGDKGLESVFMEMLNNE